MTSISQNCRKARKPLFPDLAASHAKRPRHIRESIVELSRTTLKLKVPFKSDYGFMEYDRTDRPQKPPPLYSSDANAFNHAMERTADRCTLHF